MELEKGKWDCLEGTVVIYSKLKNFDNPGEPVKCSCGRSCGAEYEDGRVFAVYLTTDITRFVDKFGLPEEIKEKIQGEFLDAKNNIDNILSRMGVPGNVKKELVSSAYASPMQDIENEADLAADVPGEDKLFMGEYSDPGACNSVLTKGIEYYIFRLADQFRRKTGLNRAKQEEEIAPEKAYKDVPKEEFRQYMMSTFVVPLIDSSNYSRKNEFRDVKKRFFEFCRDTPIGNDAVDLCIAIGSGKNNVRLIEAYIEKIVAIKNEDYETAAKIRDDIKRYRKELE